MPPDPITRDDVVLDVLMTVREEQRSLVSLTLVRELYELQRRYQFEVERDQAILGIQRAVEAEVDRLIKQEEP
jgi:hypothetical protein